MSPEPPANTPAISQPCFTVRDGIAQADWGEFIEEPDMDTRLEQMLRS